MRRRVILSTDSAVLIIYFKSENCAMEISKDRQSLMIEQKEEKNISEIQLELMENLEQTRVRIDATFPLIFKDGEEIRCSELEVCPIALAFRIFTDQDQALFNIPAESKEYSLNITIQLESEVKTRPSISVIYSGWILVESKVLCVSKELLAVSSEYFTSFFYGNYQESNSEVKSIKEVSKTDFEQFMCLIHKRKFVLPSVRMALIYLGFADYFGMKAVIAKTVPFLLKSKLSESLLNEGLKMADRIPNNMAILEWVLKNISDSDKLFLVLRDTIPIISKETVQLCLKRLQEKCRVAPTTYKDEASLMASLNDKVGIDLRRYSYSNKYLDSKYLSVHITRPTPSTIRIALDDIWPHVPSLVNRISTRDGGQRFSRGVGKTIDLDDVKLIVFRFRSII